VIGEPPPFFNRGPSPLARLTFFGLAAIGLMIADHRFGALDAVRLSLSVLVHPIQQVAALPALMGARVGEFFTTQERLTRENSELKVKLLELSAAAQQSRLLRSEQEHILSMAPGKSRYASDGVVSEGAIRSRASWSSTKGSPRASRPGCR
jgi:rod shape-determining protein MreC